MSFTTMSAVFRNIPLLKAGLEKKTKTPIQGVAGRKVIIWRLSRLVGVTLSNFKMMKIRFQEFDWFTKVQEDLKIRTTFSSIGMRNMKNSG